MFSRENVLMKPVGGSENIIFMANIALEMENCSGINITFD